MTQKANCPRFVGKVQDKQWHYFNELKGLIGWPFKDYNNFIRIVTGFGLKHYSIMDQKPQYIDPN